MSSEGSHPLLSPSRPHHAGRIKWSGIAIAPVPISDGPSLSSFDSKEHNTYLLFLVKQPDGKYTPASGQVDPGVF